MAIQDALTPSLLEATVIIESKSIIHDIFPDNYPSEFYFSTLIRKYDIVYKKRILNKIKPLINKEIQRVIQASPKIKSIEIPEQNNRVTLIIAGGPGSGKSTSEDILKNIAKKRDISWTNIVKISTDMYNPLLLNPEEVRLEEYAPGVKDESSLVNRKIQREVGKMIETSAGPHIYYDQVFIDPKQLRLALLNNGSVEIVVVSTETETAVERSYDRGPKIGRLEATQAILKGHRGVVVEMIRDMPRFGGKKITLTIVDNNVPQGCLPEVIAEIYFYTKVMTIFNDQKLLKFFKKTKINTQASSPNESYLKITNNLFFECMAPFWRLNFINLSPLSLPFHDEYEMSPAGDAFEAPPSEEDFIVSSVNAAICEGGRISSENFTFGESSFLNFYGHFGCVPRKQLDFLVKNHIITASHP